MNILYVDQTGKLGGGELSLLDWLSAVPEGAQLALFEDGPFRGLVEALGIPVMVFPLAAAGQIRRESGWKHVLATLPALAALRRSLARAAKGADVLYANSQKAFLLSALARRRGQPLVWHLRDILSAEHFSPLLRRVAVETGNRCATVILVNSHATAEAFVAAGGARDKLRFAPDGVDPRPFKQTSDTEVDCLRREIAASTPGLRIGLFGRLAPWKGQHILLEAVATIPQVQVYLVGDALFGEDGYAETLRTRASEPDLDGRVHLLGFRREIPGLMRCMDVIVHASTAAEPLGRVILEGMMAGRPVIATRAGGAMEIVTDRQTGLLVAPGNVGELQDAIKLLCNDPDLAARLASAGKTHAEEQFSLSTMVERVKAVLADLPLTRSKSPFS